MIASANTGADVVDTATDAMYGLTSQPLLGSIAAAIRGTNLDAGFSLGALGEINIYWENLRYIYAPSKSGQLSGTIGHVHSQYSRDTVYQFIVLIQSAWVD